MLGTRWQPFVFSGSDWNRLQNEVEKVFEHFTGTPVRQFSRSAYPAANVWEEDDNLHVEAELPGLELDDLEIYVSQDNQLTIKGERKQPELTNGTWLRQERGFGHFARALQLPLDVDAEAVTAEFKHGVLTIRLPKKPEIKPRRIEVNAS